MRESIQATGRSVASNAIAVSNAESVARKSIGFAFRTRQRASVAYRVQCATMSNFQRETRHPDTGEMKLADWLDVGARFYVVRFPDGKKFCETEIAAIATNGVSCESTSDSTNIMHWDGTIEKVQK